MVEEQCSGDHGDVERDDSGSTFDRAFEEFDIDEEEMFLTRRQATVLALRERGADQGKIADYMECSRANVSNIERSARENIEKARATLSLAEMLTAPVRVELPADVPLHEAADRIYEACDDVSVKVNHGAPDLIRKITAMSPESERRGRLTEDLVVTITADGEVHLFSP